MQQKFIAHHRKSDNKVQSVGEHLMSVSAICGDLAGKIGVSSTGQLLGLLHDLGKYSHDFQVYIKSATDILNPDIDGEYVDYKGLKGKIDHSTAGAQWIWQQYGKYGLQGRLAGQILAVGLTSHHGGMLDCLRVDGQNGFRKRITKDDEKTHLQECLAACNPELKNNLYNLVTESCLKDFFAKIVAIIDPQKKEHERLKHFRLGFLTRFLFSCLVDSDRIDSADFENPDNTSLRQSGSIEWRSAIARLEEKLASFNVRNQVDEIRNQISSQCLSRADDPQGIYTLTVPTGGGKTFASMRYALHHAKKYKLDHIFYIIPYTSIIEQNAQVIREVLEQDDEGFPWVMEHHSNLEPEIQTWQTKLACENWDAPIIFTTMVQFLEVMFGGGTRGARRLHNLANSVIIFDEIQSLPINCVHLFCNGLQFLVDHAGSTAVLCTATQPLLSGVDPAKGGLNIPVKNEIVHDVATLFEDLKRVDIKNLIRPSGWNETEVAEFACEQVNEKGNCLVIVNTKKWAQNLYESCVTMSEEETVFHLSTSLCPAHRKEILTKVNQRLTQGLPVLCISTQLIEAGVDIDFNAVIRFLAGLDSIAQAAGRCNRNGNHDTAQVYVVNPKEEAIDMLENIKVGRDQAWRVLEEKEHVDFLSPSALTRYFSYYFYERAGLMAYPLKEKEAGRSNDTLLNLLSDNIMNVGREKDQQKTIFTLQQSFKTAGKAFKAIDAPTQAVIVQYGEGKKIVAELCGAFEPSRAHRLLKKAQKYSVNVFPNIWQRLKDAGAVFPIQEGEKIYFLDERYYSSEFGVSTEIVGEMDAAII